MTATVKSWIKENYFLGGLVIAIFSVTAYIVKLETRITTLETRGSPHLQVIDNRLTVLESLTKTNKESIERIVDKLTK
jgi:hypothetical protein